MVEQIRELCNRRSITLRDLEKACGIGFNAIYKWDSASPNAKGLKAVADYFDVPMDYFYGKTVQLQAKTVGSIFSMPVVGTVKAGYDGTFVEDYSGEYIQIPNSSLRGYPPNECRVVSVRGSSMYQKLEDGDKVLIHLQSDIDSGDTAVVMLEWGDATISLRVV